MEKKKKALHEKLGIPKLPSREEMIAEDPLGKFFVWWDDIKLADVDSFERCLNEAKSEHEIQSYLEKNPMLLVQHLSGGHGRYVIPQKRLGAEYVTDFVIGEWHSFGYDWQAVELESPTHKMFNRNGDPSYRLNHAIRQIHDWRAWLTRNQNYAARLQSEGGLGLTDITPEIHGLIFIGRRRDIDTSTNDRRRQMVNSLKIKIHSYDFLLDLASNRIKALDDQKQKGK